MNVVKIVVDEIPIICNLCHFEDILDYVGCHFCYASRKAISREKNYSLQRPDWCPLQLEEVCEFTLRKIDYAGFKVNQYSPTCGGTSINNTIYKYCPSCGKRIKYESEE